MLSARYSSCSKVGAPGLLGAAQQLPLVCGALGGALPDSGGSSPWLPCVLLQPWMPLKNTAIMPVTQPHQSYGVAVRITGEPWGCAARVVVPALVWNQCSV